MSDAWKDEIRTVLAQNIFTCVSCSQAQFHQLVYFVVWAPKEHPDGLHHLPKLLNDCGCPSELYSTCHRQKEEDLNRIIQEPTEDSKAEVDWRLQDSSRVWELSSHREEFKNPHKTLRLK